MKNNTSTACYKTRATRSTPSGESTEAPRPPKRPQTPPQGRARWVGKSGPKTKRRNALGISANQRGMLFGLWNEACQQNGWDAKNDQARDSFTRQALALELDAEIPSWSDLTDGMVSTLKRALGAEVGNFGIVVEAETTRRQYIWSCEANARTMCDLGPAYSEAEDTHWVKYIQHVLRDMCGEVEMDFRKLPTTAANCIDLSNLSKLTWNRLYRAALRGGLNTGSMKLKPYLMERRKQVMADVVK